MNTAEAISEKVPPSISSTPANTDAEKQGRRYGWSADEDNILRTNTDKTARELAPVLGRCFEIVRLRAKKLGVELAHKRDKNGHRGNRRKWTKSDDLKLAALCENLSTHQIAARMNRTYVSVKHRLELKGWKACCGTYTLQKLEKETGYNARQLLRAAKELKAPLNRGVNRGRIRGFAISEEQMEAIVEHLRNDTGPLYRGYWKRIRVSTKEDKGYKLKWIFPVYPTCNKSARRKPLPRRP